MLTREQILGLIPHDGAMCLLDHVTEWDQSGIRCSSRSHLDGHSHPLWRGNGVAAVHLIEYGAQTAAVHAGLLADESTEPAARGGYLAGLRNIEFTECRIDTITTALDIRAYREMGGPQGMIYRFAISSAGVTQCSGRLTIMGAT